jgi:hypothetical protein
MSDAERDELEYSEAEVIAILDAYRKNELRRQLTGPVISFGVHILLLALLFLLVVDQPFAEAQVTEIDITPPPPEKVVPLPPEAKIEIDETKVEDIIPDPQISSEAPAPDKEVEPTDDPSVDPSDEPMDDPMDLTLTAISTHGPPIATRPGPWTRRGPDGLGDAVNDSGDDAVSQNAVHRALNWLASVQRTDGSWEGNPAHTGMALLCFLGYGHTPISEQHGLTVQKAMQWLATGMPEEGELWHSAYAHAIATYAVAESYGMTQIPFMGTAMESGIGTIIRGQQADGGFDYKYKKGPRWDLSVTGWQMQALKAAYIAGSSQSGVSDALDKGAQFIRDYTYGNGGFGYTTAGDSRNMAGVGTLCLQLMGQADTLEGKAGVENVMSKRLAQWEKIDEDWEAIGPVLYGLYYDTQVAFQSGRQNWRAWDRAFQQTLVKAQRVNGNKGYWTTEKAHHRIGGEDLGGKVLATTLCTLQLEVYVRYLPTFKIHHTAKKM